MTYQMQASQCASRKKVHISRMRMRLLYCEYLSRGVYLELETMVVEDYATFYNHGQGPY